MERRMTIQEWIRRMYPQADSSHDFRPEYDGDNCECVNCGVRPYNAQAVTPCHEPHGHGGPK